MLKAKFYNDFFKYGRTGLDRKACALILNSMNDPVCGRFLSNAMVGHAYSETTGMHIQRTDQTIGNMIRQVVIEPKQRQKMLPHYKAMITLHDVSDIIKEVIVASTETDPVLSKQCKTQLRNYDLAVTPFIYQLAMFSVQEETSEFFNAVIDEMRGTLLKDEHHDRGFSMPEAIQFCDDAVELVQQNEKEFSHFRNWDTPKSAQKINVMMKYYNEIEQTETFEGLLAQIHEKSDGTKYACNVSIQKNSLGLKPTHYHCQGALMNRINGRYEKNLAKLMQEAKNDPIKQALAACTIQHSYNISKTVYSLCKPHLSLSDIRGEPGEDNSHEEHEAFLEKIKLLSGKKNSGVIATSTLVDLYQQAIDDMTLRGVCWLPEIDKTLASSNTIEKYTLDEDVFKRAANYLQSPKTIGDTPYLA